jgi:Predicted sugar isomerase
MEEQQYGAGIWHFATYVDRYATDGYGEPRSVLDAIELAGKVQDLSVVDINYPYFGGNFTHEDIKVAVDKAGLGVIGITPEIYTREFRKGAFTNPDSGIRRRAHELITESCEAVRFFNASYV